ncbi:hypothetical protein GCM10027398_20480 [Azotobacter salinestris]
MESEFLVGTFGVAIHVVGGQEDSTLADRAIAEFVQVVPDEIDAAGHLPEQRRVLVSNANAQGLGVLHEARVPWILGNPRAASRPALFIHALKVRALHAFR